MIIRKVKSLKNLPENSLTPVVYLICVRAIVLSAFMAQSGFAGDFFMVFGDKTLIHSVGWASVAMAAALLALAGTVLKRGAVVAAMCMVLFVLWLYLVSMYLYSGQLAYALIETPSMLLFAYLYVAVSINRAWGWVPRYAQHDLTPEATSDRL